MTRLVDTMKAAAICGVLAVPAMAQQAPTPPTAPTPATPTAPSAVPARPATVPGQTVEAVSVPNSLRASRLIGTDVLDDQGSKIGEIDDLVITRNQPNPAAVLSVGGFLGIGSRLVVVPFERLTTGGDGKLRLPGATADSLRAMPEFRYPS